MAADPQYARALRALTRFHCAGAHRRTFSRQAQRDRRRSAAWGWHDNVIGMGGSWKRVHGKTVTEEFAVTFFVLRKEPAGRLLRRERIPARLDVDSVEASVLTDVVELPGRCVAHGKRIRPLQSCAEVGHAGGGLGTLGLIVRKRGTSGPDLALSCSHVMALSGALADSGKSVEQPTGDNRETVGSLTADFSTLRSGTLATFDVALAALTAQTAPGIVGSAVVPKTISPKAAKDFRLGERTVLFGVHSGRVEGRVAAFESTFDIARMPFVNGHVEFSGLVAYETRSAKGDSGGVVMSGEPGQESMVLGIHTAGRSDGKLGLFQPIAPIMAKFGLELRL
jgi:hypothetical protein